MGLFHIFVLAPQICKSLSQSALRFSLAKGAHLLSAMGEPHSKRFTLLVLFQAQQDHATELVIAPSAGEGAPIQYKVGGTWYDFSPPPSHILPDVVAELWRLAKLPEAAFPKVGTNDLPVSGVRLAWKIQMGNANEPCMLAPIRE